MGSIMGGMRALIGYPVAVALGLGLGACAEASRPPPNEATGVEDGGDDGAAGATAASPDAATRSTDAGTDAATRSTDAGTDAATRSTDAGALVPTTTTDAGTGLEPIRVFRGDPAGEFWDLTLRGEELEHLDGRVVTVRVGSPLGGRERLGSGQTRIHGGGFELFLAGVWEEQFYKSKVLYIDVDQNGRCDGASDLVFSDARAVEQTVLTVRVSPPFSDTDLRPSTEAAGHCEELNEPWPTE
jgi:hypothetical protein